MVIPLFSKPEYSTLKDQYGVIIDYDAFTCIGKYCPSKPVNSRNATENPSIGTQPQVMDREDSSTEPSIEPDKQSLEKQSLEKQSLAEQCLGGYCPSFLKTKHAGGKRHSLMCKRKTKKITKKITKKNKTIKRKIIKGSFSRCINGRLGLTAHKGNR